jgi:hypothetical protein
VRGNPDIVRDVVQRVADERGWPAAEYLLAMKRMAMRIAAVDAAPDQGDIEALAAIAGIQTADQALDLAASFYPQQFIPPPPPCPPARASSSSPRP